MEIQGLHINAAKRVRIFKDGIIVDDIKQDKFQQAKNTIVQNQGQEYSDNAAPNTAKKACTHLSRNILCSAATSQLMSMLVMSMSNQCLCWQNKNNFTGLQILEIYVYMNSQMQLSKEVTKKA